MRVSGNGPSCQTPNHKSACPGGTEFPGIHSNYLLLYRGFGATYYRGGGFPSGSVGKKICLQGRRHSRHRFDPWVRKIPWRKWQPTPVFFPGDSHGQRSLVCYSPWGHQELDMTEWLSTRTRTQAHTHTHTHTHTLGLDKSQEVFDKYLQP